MKHVLCPAFVALMIVPCVQAADHSTVVDNTAQVSEARPEVEKTEALTFRILASRAYPQDEDMIRRGIAEPGRNILDSAGKIEARWIPIVASQKSSSFDNPDFVVREHEKTLEVLVKYDDNVNVTGEDLTRITRETGRAGNHTIAFAFNAIGANKLARLTSANLPDPAQSDHFRRHLGVIFYDQLYAAPTIMAKIQGSGVLEFSPGRTEAERKKLNQDIDDLVELLRTRYSLRTEKER